MSKYECLCIQCGTQCGECWNRYPGECICIAEEERSLYLENKGKEKGNE
jgi:hypothetical protein